MKTRLKTIVIGTIISTLAACSASHFSNYWPYSQIHPTLVKKLIPINYNDCIPALDSILSPIVKQHFKEQDSSIAAIRICEDIGGFFTTNWKLYRYNKQYHWPNNYTQRLPDEPVDIASRFIDDGIYHPKAMIRIMFTCYHKHLNKRTYSWEEEIQKAKELWPQANPTSYKASLPNTVANLENRIISKYEFNILKVADTVNLLYNRPPRLSSKSSDWYYISGVIKDKYPETESIDIEIVNIDSEFKDKFMPMGNDTLHIGDTLSTHHKGWLSRNHSYFNYNRCVEQRRAFNVY